MLTFIIRRLLWTVLVMFVITVVVFILFFKTPGVDPARALVVSTHWVENPGELLAGISAAITPP